MIKVAFVTTTRADFSLNYPIIVELRKHENKAFKVELIVTGTHLSEDYGLTIDDIKKSGIRIDKIIHVPVCSQSSYDIANNQVAILQAFSSLFSKTRYKSLCILGDRYEMLPIAMAALDYHIPIIHLYGGDTTEGAIDEYVRHAITKMSIYHFPTNELSRKRIIQMGEDPDRVFNFGAPGVDNIRNLTCSSKIDVLESIGIRDCNYALCIFHPVTHEITELCEQVKSFLEALLFFNNMDFVVIKSNNDEGGAYVNTQLEEVARDHRHIHLFSSIRFKTYVSLMRYAEFVIGNSSSGIMEAPSFRIPTINIGNRQKGRLMSESIINCEPNTQEIINAIKYACSAEFRAKCSNINNPYGDGMAAPRIASKIVELVNNPINMEKEFFLLPSTE